MHRGVSVQGVSVQGGVSVLGGSVQAGVSIQGVPVMDTPYNMVMNRQYTSYWNAFLFYLTFITSSGTAN